MIYLASRYSGTEEEQHQRYLDAVDCCSALFSQGIFVISPIVHWHYPARRYNLGKDAEFWKTYNHSLLSVCTELYVLQNEGWEKSNGVQLELQWAKEQDKPKMRVIPDGGAYRILSWR